MGGAQKAWQKTGGKLAAAVPGGGDDHETKGGWVGHVKVDTTKNTY